ncbi:MAG: hypothetical protein JNM78_04845 [Cyclobacteriaceae bacterium]|nr:hypothetical protein [Cyclobacteriaceae bacterium]
MQRFNPLTGGGLLTGYIETLNGGDVRFIGTSPVGFNAKNQDWVVMIKKTNQVVEGG